MKKLSFATIVTLVAILAALWLLPAWADMGAALAEAPAAFGPENPLTVRLGDGAPIPFFDEYASQVLSGPDAISGITGAADAVWTEDEWRSEDERWQVTYTLQNVALTDDVLAAFFILRSERPLVFDAGQEQHGFDWAVPWLNWRMGGEHLETVALVHREGHPLDANTLSCMVVYSLAQPLPENATLVLGAPFSEQENRFMDEQGIHIQFDRSAEKDPTQGYRPMVQKAEPIEIWGGEKAVDFDFMVERVAFTPFGNRVLLNFTSRSERDSSFDLAILDDEGRSLPIFSKTGTGNSLASKEHPQQVRNEVWFMGGEGSRQLTLVPIQWKSFDNYADVIRQTVVPLGQLPCELNLDNGGKLRVERCDISGDGFLVSYVPQGLTGHLAFDLAGTDGKTTGFNFVSYDAVNLPKGFLQKGGYWSQEYKGRIVSRVTAEEIQKAKGLLVEYRMGEQEMLTRHAIQIPLENK